MSDPRPSYYHLRYHLRVGVLIETPRPCRVVVVDGLRLSEVAMGRAMEASPGPRGGSAKLSGTRTLTYL